jgi:hypothetical protein
MNFYDKYIKYKNKYTRLLQSLRYKLNNNDTMVYAIDSVGSIGPMGTGDNVGSIGPMGAGNSVGNIEPIGTDNNVGNIEPIGIGNMGPIGAGNSVENIEPIGTDNSFGNIGPSGTGDNVGNMELLGAGKGCSVIRGSGVIIVSIINNTPCILLPREKNKSYAIRHKLNNNFNLHEDIGGGIHYDNLTVEENTIFELYEETAGYIICNPSKLKKKIVDENNNKYDSHIDLEYKKGSIYRCYIIGINGTQLNINQINSNLNILTNYKKFVDKHYFECDNWTWFPIKNFNNNKNYIQGPNYKNNFNETYIIVNDIFNNPKFISSRTWKILLQSYNKQGIKGIDLCYKIIKNIKNINKLKLYNKNDYTTILPLLQFPINSVYL